MKHQRKHDFSPLVILISLTFVIILLAIIFSEDNLSLLIYLILSFFLAGILYDKGVKPIDSNFSGSLFCLALVTKLVSSAVNYWFLTRFYGVGDANVYHKSGIYISKFFSRFDTSVLDTFNYGASGTTNMVFLTGAIYTLLPPSLPGAFFLFASLAFAGSVLFYRSYHIAFSTPSNNLFRLGIFFLPSILYWPSALGKDAWVFFGSSLVAYGMAKKLRQNQISGLFFVGLGLFSVSFIRPHIASFLGIAVIGAYIISLFNSEKKDARKSFIATTMSSLLIIGLAFFAFQSGSSFFGFEDYTQTELESVYNDIQNRYVATSGSNFNPVSIFTPAGAIQGIITVLFRPFPWETHNIPSLIASFEALLLLGVIVARRKTLWLRIRSLATDPWIAFLLLYSLIMLLSLTVIGNFGILTRQRVMVLPFFWMLLV